MGKATPGAIPVRLRIAASVKFGRQGARAEIARLIFPKCGTCHWLFRCSAGSQSKQSE
jgi:hypothetical protein